ncbi:MAG: ABC transporter ATP-binding protein [Clostridia bacterium]|nr:ABC transporter ATP-binding protein [Clostridia bacterium]
MYFIEVRKLEKKFDSVAAVSGIDFNVQKGEIFGLLGPNGAGKSTVISMMCGLIKPTNGDVIIDGQSILKNAGKVKKLLGVVPQDVALYPTLTARENLGFWGRMYGLSGEFLQTKVEQVLDIIGLKNREDERIDRYSGGMKRRVNIAVALLNDPELLIMDEPTVGIDPQSRNHILETVKKLNRQGMTVIYTSHYMEEAEYLCDRVGVMDYGKIIALGTNQQLKKMVGEQDRIEIVVDRIYQEAIQHIRSIQSVKEATVQENSISIMARDGSSILAELLGILTGYDSGIKTVSVHQPNLESVFLHLTGRALRD